jgi:hypothetical protein
MVHYPIDNKGPVCCDRLLCEVINKFSTQKLLFFNNSVEYSHANKEAIDCNYTVKTNEA